MKKSQNQQSRGDREIEETVGVREKMQDNHHRIRYVNLKLGGLQLR